METTTIDSTLSDALDSKLSLTVTATANPVDFGAVSPPLEAAPQPTVIISAEPSAPRPVAEPQAPPSSKTYAAGTFPIFPLLPAELRLTIWRHSFQPRAVELHARRGMHYADAADPARRQPWHSRSRNPAALSTCVESRAVALDVYTMVIPVETETDDDRNAADTWWGVGSSVPRGTQPRQLPVDEDEEAAAVGGVDGRRGTGKLLYLAPGMDMLVVLGDFNRRVIALVQSLLVPAPREQGGSASTTLESHRGERSQPDESRQGLRRLALSVGSWTHDDGARTLRVFGRNVFAAVEEFVLFMYSERRPPAHWTDGQVVLRRCDEQYAYRQLVLGRGRQFRDGSEWMKVGKERMKIRDLEFVQGW